jgi:hypothetical protein
MKQAIPHSTSRRPTAARRHWLALAALLGAGLLPGTGLLTAAGLLPGGHSYAQETPPGGQAPPTAAAPAAESPTAAAAATTSGDPELIAKLEKYLTGATLKGRYTVLGRDVPPADEEYTIQSAKKLPEGDLWLLEARIKYGKWDLTVPLTFSIKWADKTPVITVEKLTIPAMGTFSARVLFHNEMYSGTWSHDDVKGQLFGQVIPAQPENSAAPVPAQDK